MDFEDFLKTIDVDASQNMLVFSLEDMKAAWDAAFTHGYDEGWDDCEKHEKEVWRKGHVLVPLKPTKKMIEASLKVKIFGWLGGEMQSEIYEAMIAAAQEEE